jgi:hypothetical protein
VPLAGAARCSRAELTLSKMKVEKCALFCTHQFHFITFFFNLFIYKVKLIAYNVIHVHNAHCYSHLL